MDQARGHLLAGAGLTLEHHCGAAGRDLANQGQLFEAGGAFSDVSIGEARDGLAYDAAESCTVGGCNERTGDQSGKLSGTVRLEEIAERALCHRSSARRIVVDKDD